MTKLIIASCTADVYLYVDHIPASDGDAKVLYQETVLGGCGYHVAKACSDSILVCPVGTGVYGDFVKEAILREALDVIMPASLEPNGVCICLIEPGGQRTFIANHGAEYHFTRDMFQELPDADWIYVSGIDLEEAQNQCLMEYLKTSKAKIFFAPGPRVQHILKICEDMLKLHPVIHMNKEELEAWTQRSLEQGMFWLYKQTGQAVIVTDSKNGSYAYHGTMVYQPSIPVVTKNATGAGDTHAASCLDSLSQNLNIDEMLRLANEAARRKIQGDDQACGIA